MIRHWIEAMRLRTLPVSVSGVIMGVALCAHNGPVRCAEALLCLLFAVLAQISSNFGNEYFDWKGGIDKKGRAGFRRGLTEGDISPGAMRIALSLTLTLACLAGLGLLFISREWWILIPGVLIPPFALAYSTGPWPLSHHGLGDVAVLIFFGIIPVSLSAYLCDPLTIDWSAVMPVSLAIGLLGVNVLIVNNYRDYADDAAVGKRTTAVIMGRKRIALVYLVNGVLAMMLMWPVWAITLRVGGLIVPGIYLAIHVTVWRTMLKKDGSALNPLLGITAMLMLMVSLLSSALLLLTR